MAIRVCTLDLLDEVALFAAERNTSEALRCRPFLLDTPLETIKKDYLEYIEGDAKDILLQYDGDSLIGVTGVYWIEDDLYISFTRGIFFEGDYHKITTGFVDYLSETFSGYKLYINTASEHIASVDYFANSGFELLEDAVLYVLNDYDGFGLEEGIEFLNDTNTEAIWNRLNSIITPDTYWNMERVIENLDKFIVIGYFDLEIQGALYAHIYKDKSVEVYGIATEHSDAIEHLMKALIYKCGTLKARRLWLYTEEKAEIELAIKMGFDYYDSNKCFVKVI